MKAIKLILCSLLIIAFVSGCKDDEKSNTDLLLGNWMMAAFTATDSASVVNDIYASFPACQKDDLFIFQSGGSYISDEGALKCNASNPQQTTGTWSFNNDETVLTILEGTDTTVLTIIELSESTLKASLTISGAPSTATLMKM